MAGLTLEVGVIKAEPLNTPGGLVVKGDRDDGRPGSPGNKNIGLAIKK